MLLCLHVEFVFMLMPFTWLTDDLLKDNPPSKLRLSISAAQICLFCEKYGNPRNLGIVRACADKSRLCLAWPVTYLYKHTAIMNNTKWLSPGEGKLPLKLAVIQTEPMLFFRTQSFRQSWR